MWPKLHRHAPVFSLTWCAMRVNVWSGRKSGSACADPQTADVNRRLRHWARLGGIAISLQRVIIFRVPTTDGGDRFSEKHCSRDVEATWREKKKENSHQPKVQTKDASWVSFWGSQLPTWAKTHSPGAPYASISRNKNKKKHLQRRAELPYHGERHAVNLVFVFGLVLSEGTVPAHGRQRDTGTRSERGRGSGHWHSKRKLIGYLPPKNDNEKYSVVTSDVRYWLFFFINIPILSNS